MADVKLKQQSPFICPECGGEMWLMYRTPNSRIKCDSCGHECEQSAARRRHPKPPTDKEIIRANAALLREAAGMIEELRTFNDPDESPFSNDFSDEIIDLIQRLEEAGKE